MAKRRKKSGTTRRRVSGVSKKGAMDALTTIGGAVAGNVAANMIGKSFTSLTGLMKGLVFVGGGVALSSMSKDKLIQSVGVGVAINGATVLLGPGGITPEGIISGIGSRRRIGAQRVVRRGGALPYGQQGVIGRNGRYITDALAGINGTKNYSSYSSAADYSGKSDFK